MPAERDRAGLPETRLLDRAPARRPRAVRADRLTSSGVQSSEASARARLPPRQRQASSASRFTSG
jgi:hypothetical protein